MGVWKIEKLSNLPKATQPVKNLNPDGRTNSKVCGLSNYTAVAQERFSKEWVYKHMHETGIWVGIMFMKLTIGSKCARDVLSAHYIR